MLAAATPPIVRRSPPTSAASDLRRPTRAFRAAVGVAVVAMLVAAPAGARVAPEAALHRLQAAIDADLRQDPSIPGEALAVSAPGLHVALAAGRADVQAGTPLAADTRVSHRERDEDVRRRRGPPPGGGAPRRPRPSDRARTCRPSRSRSCGRAATTPIGSPVRQLLRHTGGLFDYATTDAYDEVNATDPEHRWTACRTAAIRGRPRCAGREAGRGLPLLRHRLRACSARSSSG